MTKIRSKLTTKPDENVTNSHMAQDAARLLYRLRDTAQTGPAILAVHQVVDLIELVSRYHREHDDCLEIFSTAGDVDHSFEINDGIFPNAHIAAISHADAFNHALWDCLDPEGIRRARDLYFADNGVENHHRLFTCSGKEGFDPQLIEANWEKTQAFILERLDDDWHSGFRFVGPRIERERVTVEFQGGEGDGGRQPKPTKKKPKKVSGKVGRRSTVERDKKWAEEYMGYDGSLVDFAKEKGKKESTVRAAIDRGKSASKNAIN